MKYELLSVKMLFFAVLIAFMSQIVAATPLLSTKVSGKGSPIILIHGLSCSGEVWNETVAHYQDKYELHVVTLAGHGNSQTFEGNHYLSAVRDELIAYVKENKLQKPILIGHSMGGTLSLWAASKAPGLFGKVIVVDGLPYMPALSMPYITPEIAKPIVEQMVKAEQGLDQNALRTNQEAIIAGMIRNEAKRAFVTDINMRSNRATIHQSMLELYTTDLRKEISQIDVPVLMLGAWAAYANYGITKAMIHAAFTEQVKNIPNAKVAIAESAYHFIFYDEPAWFTEQIDNFLAQ
jgi:pimeloyl-ACP methyl ester carboxylesterase